MSLNSVGHDSKEIAERDGKEMQSTSALLLFITNVLTDWFRH